MVRPAPRSPDAYERFCQAVDGPMTVLAIVWLLILVLPSVIHLDSAASGVLDTFDYSLWSLFIVEYLVKLVLAPSRWGFVRTHLLDLIVILVPFLRPVRALRFLRLIRAGAIAGQGLGRARRLLTEHGLHYVLLVAVVLVFAGAAIELGFERDAPGSNIHTFGDALWWAVVTLTTVGYGDRFPVTSGGRAVAVVLMLVGIGLLGVITANIAAFFVSKGDATDRRRLQLLEVRLERIEQLLEVIAQQPAGDGDRAIPATDEADTAVLS
jgi:voltage-gated potassium channel